MALHNAHKRAPNGTSTLQPGGGVYQILGVMTRDMVVHSGDCVSNGCCDRHGHCRPTSTGGHGYVADAYRAEAHRVEATFAPAAVSIECNKPPPGVAIEIEPRVAANAVICTQVPTFGGDGGQNPSGPHTPSIPPQQGGHVGGGDFPKESSLPGLSSLLLLLLFIALGSTWYYRRMYLEASNENQKRKESSKPKAEKAQ